MKVEHCTFDNGCVLHHLRIAGKEVSVYPFVHTGRWYEREGEQGLAHYCEHLLFRGNLLCKTPDDIRKARMKFGNVINAITYGDYVVSTITGIVEDIIEIIDYSLYFLFTATITDDAVEKERTTILDEIRQSADNHIKSSLKLFNKTAFPNTAYGRDTLGTVEGISLVSAKKLRDFYHTHYVPQNSEFVVVGDIDFHTVKNQIGRWFESHPIKGEKQRPVHEKLFANTVAVAHEHRDFQNVHAFVGHTIGFSSAKEFVTLKVLRHLLTTELFKHVRMLGGHAYSTFTDFSYSRCTSKIQSYLSTSPDRYATVLDICKGVYAEIQKGNFNEEQFELSRASERKRDIMESVKSPLLAMRVVHSSTMGIAGLLDREALYEELTFDDLLRCAQTVLRPREFTEASVGPKLV